MLRYMGFAAFFLALCSSNKVIYYIYLYIRNLTKIEKNTWGGVGLNQSQSQNWLLVENHFLRRTNMASTVTNSSHERKPHSHSDFYFYWSFRSAAG